MKTLSEKQLRIMDFLRDFVAERGYPPTVRDIQRGCDISSTSVVDYNLRILEREGHIRRDQDVSRGIELLGGRVRHTALVPVLGAIAAGEPIPVPSSDTWENRDWSETVEVAEEMVRGREGVYALRVKGNSMVDALIGDGDLVLMQHQTTADDGEMVAAWLKREEETTLKKLYRQGERVRLQPANPRMRPIHTDAANLDIQGKVIGVIRRVG